MNETLKIEYEENSEFREEKNGRTVREIFDSDGEDMFRKLETEALKEIVGKRHCVCALGGGTLLRADNRKLLSGETVIALVCDSDVAYNRCLSSGERPLLADREDFKKRCAVRETLAEGVSQVKVSTDRLSKEEAVAVLLSKIKEENFV